MKKILVVDDEKPISDIVKFNLTKEGFEAVSYTHLSGNSACNLAKRTFSVAWSVIILTFGPASIVIKASNPD